MLKGYSQNHLQAELLAEFSGQTVGELAGALRLGAYRLPASQCPPALSHPFLRKHPRGEVHLFEREIRSLPGMLRRGEADLIVMDYEWEREELEHHCPQNL